MTDRENQGCSANAGAQPRYLQASKPRTFNDTSVQELPQILEALGGCLKGVHLVHQAVLLDVDHTLAVQSRHEIPA